MIGIIELLGYGRYVVSGDTPVDFLWDLFDQVVNDGPIQVQLGGATIAVSRPDAPALDAAERVARRGSADWRQAHSQYFLRQLTDGIPMVSLTLPDDLYFPLHAMRLLGIAINQTMPSRDQVRRLNIAGYTHGWGTPAYLAELARIPQTDYPYDTMGPTDLLNYLLLKGGVEAPGQRPPALRSRLRRRSGSRSAPGGRDQRAAHRRAGPRGQGQP